MQLLYPRGAGLDVPEDMVMGRSPSAPHLIAWAVLCRRNDESVVDRRSTPVYKSGTCLKTVLVTAAWSAVRVKGSYQQAQFLRLKVRRGARKAILAVDASILSATHHMLRDGVDCRDLGADHLSPSDRSTAVQVTT